MPLYHFNVHNGRGEVPDDEGQCLADDEAARTEAVIGVRSLLAADLMEGYLDLEGRLEVTDETGTLLFTIAYADAVEVREKAPAATERSSS